MSQSSGANRAPEEARDERRSLSKKIINNTVAQGVVAYGSQCIQEPLYIRTIIACTKASACLSRLPSFHTCLLPYPLDQNSHVVYA